MIRFLLIALLLFLYLLLGIPVLLVEKLVAKINPHARDISCLRMVQWAFKLMLWITGADISYIGRENVPKDRAVLYVGNHNSYFDILLTYSQCPGLTGYVAKSEMLRYPLLRDWMKRLYCVFLDRSDLRAGMQMILTCIDYIKNGISICILTGRCSLSMKGASKWLPRPAAPLFRWRSATPHRSSKTICRLSVHAK